MARTGQKLERRGKAGQGLRSRSGSTASDPGPKKLGARGGGGGEGSEPLGWGQGSGLGALTYIQPAIVQQPPPSTAVNPRQS